ncbi:MAG: tetratricopeptide repeat protein [Pseudomonadota bacterium]
MAKFGGTASPQAVLKQAMVLHQAGRLQEAVAHYRQVLKSHPNSAPVLTYCGAALLDLKQSFEAQQMLAAAVAADPKNADAHAYLGNAHQMAGRLEQAAQSYAAALEIQPNNAALQNNLGVLLQKRGCCEAAIGHFQKAVTLQPRYAQALNNLAQAEVNRGQPAAAQAAASKAVEIEPSYAEAHNTLGSAQSAIGDHAAAICSFRKAVELRPKYTEALHNLAVALVIDGEAVEAVDMCNRTLALAPASIPALATKTVALGQAERDGEMAALIGYGTHIRAHTVDPTPDYPDLATFNADLVEQILAHPSLAFEPDGHATRKGRHTGELLSGEPGPFATFERIINDAVEAYRTAQPPGPCHPVNATAPKRWALTAWSVVFEEEGHQVPHIHESGWLSGVYYPKVPCDIGESAEDPRGWIEFGRPQALYGATRMPPVHLIRPEEGLIVLFPSYAFHCTVPTGSRELRVSVAFDVMPRG